MAREAATAPSGGLLVFVGDVHLDRDDPDLEAFLAFLDTLGRTSSRLVLLGDLFNLWLGRRELEQPHQAAVVARLADLRQRGLCVRYLEGNRDYSIAAGYAGYAFDESSEEGIVEEFGGHRIHAVHGDRVNVADRRYRLWRRLSRSAAVWGTFNLLPRRMRLHLAGWLESRMRSTNLAFKQEFPVVAARAFAEPLFRDGCDLLVLGHFHVEKEIETSPPAAPGRILVLPEWKGSRRHLQVRPDGPVEFVDSGF